MSRPPVGPHAVDPPATDLAEVCDQAICRDAPVLICLAGDGKGLALDGGIPFDVPEDLLTLDVAPDRVGVALVADGRCRSMDRPDAPVVGRARFCFALTRHGAYASLMITGDGSHRADGGEMPGGHAVDVCHRLLGLCTPPEPTPVIRLVHAEWLATLAELATAPGMAGLCDDWSAVASLHPCAHATRRTGPDALGRAAAREVQDCTWERLHSALVTAGGHLGHIPPPAVARLDGPSFARFVLGGRPPISVSWAELCNVVDPRILVRVRRSMSAAGDDLDGFPLVHREFGDAG